MDSLVNIDLFKAAALLLAERRRQLINMIEENPNNVEATKEFIELSTKINHIKTQYLKWINERHNVETSAINRPSNNECRQ